MGMFQECLKNFPFDRYYSNVFQMLLYEKLNI